MASNYKGKSKNHTTKQVTFNLQEGTCVPTEKDTMISNFHLSTACETNQDLTIVTTLEDDISPNAMRNEVKQSSIPIVRSSQKNFKSAMPTSP